MTATKKNSQRLNINLELGLIAKIDEAASELFMNRTEFIKMVLAQYLQSKKQFATLTEVCETYKEAVASQMAETLKQK